MSELKNRATVEDLLGLPPEGWQAIAKMGDDELVIYLKDITELEPKINPNSQLRGGKLVEIEENDDDNENNLTNENSKSSNNDSTVTDNNPIKVKRKKFKLVGSAKEVGAANLKSLFGDLGIEL